MIRIVFITLGTLSLGLGILGIFLPILPTTPFVLLTAYCYARGSKKFYHWFIKTKIYKNHLESFIRNRSMTLKSKLTILSFASFMLLFPLIIIDNRIVRIFIISLCIYKYYYFFTQIETIKD